MQNYRPYCFIGYSNFVIGNSLCSLPWKNSSSFFNFGPIPRLIRLSFRDSEHSPNFQFLDVMLTAWRCVVGVVLPYMKKTNEQNVRYFDPCRLINNKINRLHKSTFEELLKKDWSFCFNTLKVTYNEIIMELLFFIIIIIIIVFVKKAPTIRFWYVWAV